MTQLIIGATAAASWVAGAFFWQYWRRTRDRFFAFFAASFWLMTINRVLLGLISPEREHLEVVYVIRLIAFLLIIYAVVDKNRTAGRPASG